MSFNPDPKWTTDIKYPNFDNIICPYCQNKIPKKQIDNYLEEGIYAASYYIARHIPPYIIVTCYNCESDFFINLSLDINIKSIDKEI